MTGRARHAKMDAGNATWRAVKAGTLERPEHCERCGGPGTPRKDGAARIQAHHHDYGPDRWLDVRWLCRACHKDADRARRAGLTWEQFAS